jgi:hypothetical protein
MITPASRTDAKKMHHRGSPNGCSSKSSISVTPASSLHRTVSDWLFSIPANASETSVTMSYDSDGFAIPSKPSSVRSSPSKEPSECSSKPSGRLVQHPLYRQLNLRANHVYLRPQDDLLPPFVSSLVARIRQTPDHRPTPSRETIQELRNLELGAPQSQVVQFFRTSFFPNAPKLKRTFSLPMSKDAVPNHDASLKISTPAPDVLYGYDRSAFSDEQLIPLGTRPVANSDDVLFPFFLAELKGDSPGGDGSLFVATNQWPVRCRP